MNVKSTKLTRVKNIPDLGENKSTFKMDAEFDAREANILQGKKRNGNINGTCEQINEQSVKEAKEVSTVVFLPTTKTER